MNMFPDSLFETAGCDTEAFARTAQSDVFGKLDCELPTLRFNSDADMELERKWRASGMGSKSEYIRLVLYVNIFGEEHVQKLHAERIKRAVGNVQVLPRNDNGEGA